MVLSVSIAGISTRLNFSMERVSCLRSSSVSVRGLRGIPLSALTLRRTVFQVSFCLGIFLSCGRNGTGVPFYGSEQSERLVNPRLDVVVDVFLFQLAQIDFSPELESDFAGCSASGKWIEDAARDYDSLLSLLRQRRISARGG